MNLELYLEQMKELVNIDSGSGNVAGINRVADKLAGWYQEIGWNVERIPADGGRQVLLLQIMYPNIMMRCISVIWIQYFRTGRQRKDHFGSKEKIITVRVLVI